MGLWRFRKRRSCSWNNCEKRQECPYLTLDEIEKGQCCRILSIPSEMIRAQALRFGISEGEIVTCREKVPAGPVVIAKNRQEIAVGRRLARQIRVTQVEK